MLPPGKRTLQLKTKKPKIKNKNLEKVAMTAAEGEGVYETH